MLKSKFKEQGIVLEDAEDRDLLEYYAYCEYHYESIFEHVDESIGFNLVEAKIIREVHVFNRFLMDGEPFTNYVLVEQRLGLLSVLYEMKKLYPIDYTNRMSYCILFASVKVLEKAMEKKGLSVV